MIELPTVCKASTAEQTDLHEKPAAYREGDGWIVRGSALGQCPLRVALKAHGRVEEVSDTVKKAWELGHEHEQIVKARLRARGYVIDSEQGTIELQCGPIAKLRGHTDGQIVINVDGLGEVRCVLEVKSMTESSYERWLTHGLDAFPNYKKQISFYSHALDLPIFYAVQCKSDLSLSCRFYAKPLVQLFDLQAEVYQIIGMLYRLQGGETLTCDRHEEQVFACAFEEFHVPAPGKTTGQIEDEAIVLAAERYASIGKQVDALEVERAELKRRISNALDDCGHSKAKAGIFTVQWIQGRETTNWGQFLRDYPDVAERLKDYKGRGQAYLRIDGPRAKKEKVANGD